MDPSYEKGLSGGALPASGDFDQWQMGRSIHDANQAELARQARSCSQAPSAWDDSSPAWSPTSTYGAGRAGSGNIADAGAVLNLLVGILVLLTANWLLVLLYPLASVAASALVVIGVLFLQGGSTAGPAVLLVAGSVIAFWLVSRFEHRLAQHSGFRRGRHAVRLLMVAVGVYGATFAGSSVRGRPSAGQFVGVLFAVAATHVLLTKATSLRARWHGVLEAIRLRPRNLTS